MKESWKDIKRLDGLYQVSNTGKIRSWCGASNQHSFNKRDKPKIKSLHVTHYGYYATTAYFKGKRFSLYLHRELALAFIPNPNNHPLVLHKDDDKLNIDLNNLYWGTHKDNYRDRQNNFGAEKGENATNNKIRRGDAERILELIKTDLSQREVASMYNVDQSTISDIKRGKSWTHLKR